MTAEGGWVEERTGAEKFYDVMDRSGELTDGMAALASRPTGTLLVPLSSEPIDRWVGGGGVEKEEGDGGAGGEGADLECAHD